MYQANTVRYCLETIWAFNPCRRVIYLALLLLNAPTVWPLLFDASGRNPLVKRRPEIVHAMLTGFLAANLTVRDRVKRLIDHCKIVKEIGGIIDLKSDAMVELVSLTAADTRYRITLDRALWLLGEGPLVISLWDGIDRIFSLSFCLASDKGERIAYVGGVQGRFESNALDRYRRFSKASYGMRARDFLVEAFKGFCRAIGVAQILAVSDSNHYRKGSSWPRVQAESSIKLSYDEIWRERGGVNNGTGFFALPTTATRRKDSEMSSKKRTIYRKRYLMLDHIDAELVQILKCPGNATNRLNLAASGPFLSSHPDAVTHSDFNSKAAIYFLSPRSARPQDRASISLPSHVPTNTDRSRAVS
jgi:uncharacterized protein VirK/YbjX